DEEVGKNADNSGGSLGGFVGKMIGSCTKKISNCYTTGRLYVSDKYEETDAKNFSVGQFAGYLDGGLDLSGNMVLFGINFKVSRMIGRLPDTYELNDDRLKIVQVADDDTENDLQVNQGARVTAHPFDGTLPDKYPFISPGHSDYYGDWENPADVNYTAKLSLVNKNKLYLLAEIDKSQVNDRYWLTLMMEGSISGKKYLAPIWIRYDGTNFKASVEKPQTVIPGYDKSKASEFSSKNFEINTDDGDKVKIKLPLDDVTTKGGNFAKLFPKLIPGEDIWIYATVNSQAIDLTSDAQTSGAKEKSFGDSDELSFTCSKSDTSSETNGVFKMKVNSLFANGTQPSNGDSNTADIRWARHLVNLDPLVSGINKVDSSRDSDAKGLIFDKAEQKKDIDWDTFPNDNGAGGDPVTYSFFKNNDALTDAGVFYGIRNDKLTSYDGGDHTIENLTMKGNKQKSNVSGFLGSEDYNDRGYYAGLFRIVRNDLEIKNLKLKKVKAASSTNNVAAGALIGLVAGVDGNESISKSITVKLEDITLEEGTVGEETGKSSYGGLIGTVGKADRSNNRRIEVNNITFKGPTKVATSAHSGGMIGTMQDNASLKATHVTYEGKTEVKSTGNRAGGLVGKVDKLDKLDSPGTDQGKIDIQDFETTGTLEVTTTGGDQTHAGGLIGEISEGTRGTKRQITLKKILFMQTTISANASPGGLIGFLKKDNRPDVDDVTLGSAGNTFLVTCTNSYGYAGGLIGRVEDADYEQADMTISNITAPGTLNVNAQGHSVGGMIGEVGKAVESTSTGKRRKITFSQIHLTGSSITIESVYQLAGGLIGGVKNGNDIDSDGVDLGAAAGTGTVTFKSRNNSAGGLIADLEGNNKLTAKNTRLYGTFSITSTNNGRTGGAVGKIGNATDEKDNTIVVSTFAVNQTLTLSSGNQSSGGLF
ncbi:MAG: hypothetical protein IJV04_10105, partial [Lachnospiraceae bacterium]|nr:hypothetical protein [Lachnospiraceae bacterium]